MRKSFIGQVLVGLIEKTPDSLLLFIVYLLIEYFLFSVASELLILSLDLVKNRVVVISIEMRKSFIGQILVGLIEKTPDSLLLFIVYLLIEYFLFSVASELLILSLDLVKNGVVVMSIEMRKSFIGQILVGLIEKTPNSLLLLIVYLLIEYYLFSVASELLILSLDLVKNRVVVMSIEMRKSFIGQILVGLIEKTPDSKVMKAITKMVEDWVKTKVSKYILYTKLALFGLIISLSYLLFCISLKLAMWQLIVATLWERPNELQQEKTGLQGF